MFKIFSDEKHLLNLVLAISDFYKSLSLMSMSSESESDTLIYENVVEIIYIYILKNFLKSIPEGMIQRSVNARGQAKYLELYIMF